MDCSEIENNVPLLFRLTPGSFDILFYFILATKMEEGKKKNMSDSISLQVRTRRLLLPYADDSSNTGTHDTNTNTAYQVRF